MCLIVFAWQVVPGRPLILAGNRDEFFERPSAAAGWWEDHPQVFAGRDLQGGGTWLGVTREGRFAGLTNIRAPTERRTEVRSRGMLVADYLCGQTTPEAYITDISANADTYNGFNLIVGTPDKLIWYSNRDHQDARNGHALTPGVYGLSNDRLDTPWPKVVKAKAQFASLLCLGAPQDAYFDMLTDTSRPSDCRLPKTGVGIEWERILSSVCIVSPTYGTRVSSVLEVSTNGAPVLLEHLIHSGANFGAAQKP